MDMPDFDAFVLSRMPSYIAVNYQRIQEAQSAQERVEAIVHVYSLALRALGIHLVSQYLILDRERVLDPTLNDLLLSSFPHMTLDIWERIVFTALEAYEGQRDLFFVPELYELYWDTSTQPHQARAGVQAPYSRLTQAAVEMQKPELLPRTDSQWLERSIDLEGALRRVLAGLAFLASYELIRVVDCDDNAYLCELHRGLAPTMERRPLPAMRALNPGWFYLRSRADQFLLLHPLLVFWDAGDGASESQRADLGIYNRQMHAQLQYVLSASGRTILDAHNISAFMSLLYDTIEEVKRRREATDRLTWLQLTQIASDITGQRMKTVRYKYDSALYLQREKTRNEFSRFLDSDKRCFVLIGKSGVGKSNFLLALHDELRNTRRDVCMLMYDGAQIGSEVSISEIIAHDFNNRLIVADKKIEDVWQELARIDGIHEKTVVLCVDAINENGRAKELLRQLDELVQGPWPWLKVVFSSRPETWQSIRRGVKLSEGLYYQESDTQSLEVGLEPFDYSDRMEAFNWRELAEAYAKYQARFALQTPFEAIAQSVREILREPLNLWLVASTHHDQAIPESLRVAELVKQYVKELLRSDRLRPEDVRLLEKQLVPLMVRPGNYTNAITGEDLDHAGGGLYEAIYSDQVLSNQQHMNQSFRNLVDADILIRQEDRREQRIAFKYERFYEYFVGARLFELGANQSDRVTFYLGLIAETTTTPYLWGAIRSALMQDLTQGNVKTVMALCFTDQQRVKEMMTDLLNTYGIDHREQVIPLLQHLVPPEVNASGLRLMRQMTGKSASALNARARNAGKIGVEVASSLGIGDILRRASLQADATVRTAAVRYTYRLWQRDRELGFHILQQVADATVRHFIPNFVAFESTLGLSLVIFFDHTQEPEVVKRLQQVWHFVVGRILGINESSGRLGRVFRNFIRERIFAVAMRASFRILNDLPEYNILSYAGLEAFFRLSPEDKALYGRMTDYLDARGAESWEKFAADLIAVLRIRKDVLVTPICMLGLAAHVVQNPHGLLPFLRHWQEVAAREPEPNAWVSVPPVVLEAVLDRDPYDDEVFEAYVQAVKRNHAYYSTEFGRPAQLNAEVPEATYLGTYICYQYQRSGFVQTEWLRSLIDTALERGGTDFFTTLLTTSLPIVGIERGKPQAALDTLALFFDRVPGNIDELSVKFLSRLHAYYPDEVESFLEEQETSLRLQLQVRTAEPAETIGELIGLRAFRFLRDDVIIGSEALRFQVIRIFARAEKCKDAHEWIEYLIREVVNLIYQGEALRQPR